MHIVCIPAGPVRANCYILWAEGARDRVVIDPGGDAQKLKAALGGCPVSAILFTHGHFDHIAAADALWDAHTRAYIHEKDLPLLTDPEKNASFLIGTPVTLAHEAEGVTHGACVRAAGLTFTCLHTPGHTPGGACWQCGEDLFTGDTLFCRGYGRTDLYGGDFPALMASLMSLMQMDKNIAVHPGHGEDTTLGDEQEFFA